MCLRVANRVRRVLRTRPLVHANRAEAARLKHPDQFQADHLQQREKCDDDAASIVHVGEQLLARVSETAACGFEELFADIQDRAGLIVTFLALLEMIRLKLVRAFQSGGFGPIRVYKRVRPDDAPHPIGDPEAHRG